MSRPRSTGRSRRAFGALLVTALSSLLLYLLAPLCVHAQTTNTLPRYYYAIEDLAKQLRKSLGTGGTARERTIEMQGDQAAKIRTFLEAQGWSVAGVG